ncbi:MAG: 2-amino-4-ketopentanoate thiolase [Spirochaetaceae bacterium]|jgi:hypothetical protein|nr:2-amino-4-ketopentanoate thiolase [Spirochaetaceae bacterium]
MIEKNSWVRLHRIILEPNERAPGIPSDTSSVPLEIWVKGYLQQDANIGDEAEVVTLTGRHEKGTLIEVNPAWKHGFGNFVPELLQIDRQVREIVWS